MKPICPIDVNFSDQVSALLTPPSVLQVQEFHEKLTAKHPGINVRPDGEYGKGVFAGMNFEEDDLVLKDAMLFGIQHSSNKMDCLVCSHCFRFIGSVELQIGRKLFLRSLGNDSNEIEEHGFSMGSRDGIGQCSLSHDENRSKEEEDEQDTEMNSNVSLAREIIESLMNGELHLPYSNKFQLPPVVSCPGGCNEAFYCSKVCAEADWDISHSLLCTGKGSKALSTDALWRFIQHSNETNDIFLLAAKECDGEEHFDQVFDLYVRHNSGMFDFTEVISFTILRYKKLKATTCLMEKEKYKDPPSSTSCFSLLLEAWKPVAMGYKKRWWDCISLPNDVLCTDESAFRLQIKELAFTSLQLLKDAIFKQEYELLFSLELYGHIIGMFELNNLDLVVESPVEDYFLYIDDLQDSEKEKAEEITKPILDDLGEDYSSCCEGTAFYPLQSCINHSCKPNVRAFKREQDRDGQATLIALTSIQKGEEITISYIDEEEDSYEERQAQLADYGFTCRCHKCLLQNQNTKEV